MSKVLGTRLPPAIHDRLGGRDLERTIGLTIALLSVDDVGFPHVALLSYGEVLAVSPGEVRVILWQTGSALRHLTERPLATLALVEPAQVVYIKARSRPLGPALAGEPPLAGLALDVAQVLEDAEAGTEITSAARYRYTDRSREALMARWHEQHAALRRLG